MVAKRTRPAPPRTSTPKRSARTRPRAAQAVIPITMSGAPLDLSRGVIIVLSGGGFDEMNPKEVRDRMDRYIADVNADPFVQSATGGAGLRFMLLPGQSKPHVHQKQWPTICAKLSALNPTAIVILGHSNGGAAAMNLARCLQTQQRRVDLVISCDSVLTLEDIGDIYVVPPNVTTNVNSYVIPTPAWLLAPFPIGRANRRQQGDPLEGILNVGLTYNLPGALAHRNAFYHLAGGDTKGSGFKYPNLLRDITVAVLRGATLFDLVQAADAPLQTLATKTRTRIKIDSMGVHKTLEP